MVAWAELEVSALTIESTIQKILNAKDVQSLRDATAEGFVALTKEPDILARLAVLESHIVKVEVA